MDEVAIVGFVAVRLQRIDRDVCFKGPPPRSGPLTPTVAASGAGNERLDLLHDAKASALDAYIAENGRGPFLVNAEVLHQLAHDDRSFLAEQRVGVGHQSTSHLMAANAP